MRPLRLDLQGFTAFRQFTELDFNDLELFALVGPTGSGKSSLLDAMTFALYGQTARLGASGLDALISQGERGLSVSLTFEVGGQTFRASRTKGRKQAENEVRFERLDDDGRWTNLSDGGAKGISERIRKTVGLDFNTFRRSVMLPQGEFSKLLHGSGKDRQQLLGELTGLDHVANMQRVASDRAKELKHESQSLNSVLHSEYADVTAEALASIRTERERTDAEAGRLTDTREQLQTNLTRLRDIEKVWRQKEDTRRRLNVLEARAADIQAGALRADRARKVAGALPLLDAAERARIAHEREARELTRAQAQAEAAGRKLAQAEQALKAAQAQEDRIPELEAQADALKDAEADASRLKRAGGTPQTMHPNPLPWDEDAFYTAKEAADKLTKLKQERLQLTARRLGLDSLKETQKTELVSLQQLELEQERVQNEGKTARATHLAAEAELKEAMRLAGVMVHRAHLHEGEPCPLCLQIVHEVPSGGGVKLEDLERAEATAKAELDGRKLRYKEIQVELNHLRKTTEERAAALNDTEAQLVQDEQGMKMAESRIQGDPQTEALRLMAGLAAQVRRAGSDPAGQRRHLQGQIQGIRKAIGDAQNNLTRAGGEAAAANATLSAAQGSAAQREADWQHTQEKLTASLVALQMDAAQARAAALPEQDITALEEAARTHTAQRAQLREALAELDRQLGVAPFDPAQLDQVARDLTATDAALNAARERAGRLAEQFRQAQERLKRKGEIEAKAAAVSRTYDTWQTLTNTLKANEFQQFLLAEVEAQLLTRAGILLHEISDGRYRLALQDQDYVVQDLWNAGEVRGVKTLSGGETFLASLSLAIALSDYLAGNKILGALFLDEGFGTLDPQALEAVAGALESLRTQGRMVGIITHVESLSERLPSRLLVTKSVAGSHVQRLDG
ncbi:SMC family ATPase [Deinococcus cavernae]|uniref:SMC family ATPase n=1 Tax=Deinococcus cavernae TaxID=2320857 RepID=A0A418VBU1_9DEIO|nr:SMC family ATPase [Deinococcus cavernae]RJF73489.1 SMC family ATPase [Deinococcus cavernae]